MVLLFVHLCLISSELCLILLISPQCGSINGVVFHLSLVAASVCVLSLFPCVSLLLNCFGFMDCTFGLGPHICLPVLSNELINTRRESRGAVQ